MVARHVDVQPRNRQTRDAARDLTIFDQDGRRLSGATLRRTLGSRVIFCCGIDCPDQLLAYFFGRGGRQILLQRANVMRQGLLETRWRKGQRHWIVLLQEAADSGQPGRRLTETRSAPAGSTVTGEVALTPAR